MMHAAERQPNARPVGIWTLLVSTLFVAVTALFGGLNLIRDPTGASIDAVMLVDLTHLQGTPFADYSIPGIILVLLLGLLPVVVFTGQWRRTRWAWTGSMLVGVVLLLWIVVEVYLIGYISPLQPAYAVLGLGYLTLCGLPSVRRYFGEE